MEIQVIDAVCAVEQKEGELEVAILAAAPLSGFDRPHRQRGWWWMEWVVEDAVEFRAMDAVSEALGV